MNRRLFTLMFLVVTTLGVFGPGRPHPARASGGSSLNASSDCNSVSASGSLAEDWGSVNVYGPAGSHYAAPVDHGGFSVEIEFGTTYPLGTSFLVTLWDPYEHSVASVTIGCGTSSGSSSSGGSTWFLPGDSRVDGKPGDRIAVYCNFNDTPPNIDIYGITTDGWGHELARFNLADLVKAGQTGLRVTSQGLGQVVARYDGSNLFSVAWPGGQSGAPDPGDFAKDFSCGYPSTATTHGPFSPTEIQH